MRTLSYSISTLVCFWLDLIKVHSGSNPTSGFLVSSHHHLILHFLSCWNASCWMIGLNTQHFTMCPSQHGGPRLSLSITGFLTLIDTKHPPPLLSWVNANYFRRIDFTTEPPPQPRGRENTASYAPSFLNFKTNIVFTFLSPPLWTFYLFSFRFVYVHNTCLSGKHIPFPLEVDLYLISRRVRESYQNLATYKVNTH